MARATAAIRKFLADERALTTTEYTLLVALIGVAVVGVIKVAGPVVYSYFSSGSASITQAAP